MKANTVPDSYPLPRIKDCIHCMGNVKFVTKVNLLKGYCQMPLTERTSEISAFVTPDSFIQYFVMAFGKQNWPAIFNCLCGAVCSNLYPIVLSF